MPLIILATKIKKATFSMTTEMLFLRTERFRSDVRSTQTKSLNCQGPGDDSILLAWAGLFGLGSYSLSGSSATRAQPE